MALLILAAVSPSWGFLPVQTFESSLRWSVLKRVHPRLEVTLRDASKLATTAPIRMMSDADDDVEKALKDALANVGTDALLESDNRVIEGMLEDGSAELRAVGDQLNAEMDKVADTMDSKVELAFEQMTSQLMDKFNAQTDQLIAEMALKSGKASAAPANVNSDGILPGGCTVVVAGASTELAQQLVPQLVATGQYTVKALVEPEKNAPNYPSDVEVVRVRPYRPSSLRQALEDASVVILCTDTKEALDPDAVRYYTEACGLRVQRFVLVSSLGTLRTGQMPWSLQNWAGQLDKKRAIEDEVALRGKGDLPFKFFIMRTGNLVQSSKRGVALEYGDQLNGDTSYSAAAGAILQALSQPTAVNTSCSVVSVDGPPPSQTEWDDLFSKLDGPELLRVPLAADQVDSVRFWLQQWVMDFETPDFALTSPIRISNTSLGAKITFVTKEDAYADREEPEDDWGAGSEDKPKRKKKLFVPQADGGLAFEVSAEPTPRLRVKRCDMTPDVIIKPMSEEAVLKRIQKDLKRVWSIE